jgi:hypothetical protein
MDPVVAEECLSTLIVREEYKFDGPFDRGELRWLIVGLLMRRDKAHVPNGDLDEG